MKIIIAGGRTFDNYEYLKKCVDFCIQNLDRSKIEIVSGTANGADKLGERYASENGFKCTKFKPDWDGLGKAAGYQRNVQMAEYARVLIAFWDGKSKGTNHMINIAKGKGLQVKVFEYNKNNI